MYPLPSSLSIPAQANARVRARTHTFSLLYPATPSTHFTYKDDKKLNTI